jgi:hypothetical protein
MSDLDTLLDLVKRDDLKAQVKQLRAESAAFFASLPVQAGDRVALLDVRLSQDRTPGWWGYREVLSNGMPGTATKVEWSTYAKSVVILFRPEVEWSVSSDTHGHRFLRSPDKRHVYCVRLEQVRPALVTDVAPTFPGFCPSGCEQPAWSR